MAHAGRGGDPGQGPAPATASKQPPPPSVAAAERTREVLFQQLEQQQEMLEQVVCRASKAEAEADALRRELAEAQRVAKRASGQAAALHRQLSEGQLAAGQVSGGDAARRLSDAKPLLAEQQRAAASAAIQLAELRAGLAGQDEAAARAAAAAAELEELQGLQLRLKALLEEGRGKAPPSGPCRRLWVGRVTCKPSEQQVLEVAEPFGAVTSVRVFHQRSCAFVDFEHPQAAAAAMAALDGAVVPALSGSRQLVVQPQRSAAQDSPTAQPHWEAAAGSAGSASGSESGGGAAARGRQRGPTVEATAAAEAAAAAALARPLRARAAGAAGKLNITAAEWRPPAAAGSGAAAGPSSDGAVALADEEHSQSQDLDHALQLLLPSELLDSPIQQREPPPDTPPLPLPLSSAKRGLA